MFCRTGTLAQRVRAAAAPRKRGVHVANKSADVRTRCGVSTGIVFAEDDADPAAALRRLERVNSKRVPVVERREETQSALARRDVLRQKLRHGCHCTAKLPVFLRKLVGKMGDGGFGLLLFDGKRRGDRGDGLVFFLIIADGGKPAENVQPPSARISTPVRYPAPDEQRNSTSFPISYA